MSDMHNCMALSLNALDWSRVQSFLAVAEHGSLSRAAKELSLTQPTLGRHVRDFETAVGFEVFHRHAKGLALTAAGAKLLAPARAMQAAMNALTLSAEADDSAKQGVVRIASSVHVAHYVLPPIIATLREDAPDIEIVIHASDDSENLLFREADIALRMYRPHQLELVTRHIADIPIGAFATKAYLDRRGRPRAIADLMSHDLVGYDQSPLIRDEMRRLGLDFYAARFAVRCDNQTAYWELVRAGCGIGFTQVETGRSDPNLEQLSLGLDLTPLPIWLTAHETVRRIPRVAQIWDLLAHALTARFGRY